MKPKAIIDKKALVVFSGGQDSTACLGWAMRMFAKVVAVTFHYGQKHAVEVAVAREICQLLKVPQYVVDLGFLPVLSESALTSGGDVNQRHALRPDLPASFVPNRNAIFLTLAHSLAQKVGASTVVTGVCQTDYSGYPDCRQAFIEALEVTLNMASEADITIATPLMWMDKAATWQLAEDMGVLDIVVDHSHTCYNGDRSHLFAWGHGCGECPACVLRAKGWDEYQAQKKEE